MSTRRERKELLSGAFPQRSKLPSAAEMQEFDRFTIEECGTPSLVLMERAGVGVTDVVVQHCGDLLGAGASVLILLGPGNNGGDGLVVARLLHSRGCTVQVVACQASHYSEDFLVQLKLYTEKCGSDGLFVFGEAREFVGGVCGAALAVEDFQQLVTNAVISIDSLLGTGSKLPLRGGVADLLQAWLEVPKLERHVRVAIDIPSGIDADSGQVGDLAFTADVTATIQLPKRGMLQYPARSRCGLLELVDIGLNCSAATEFQQILGEQLPPFYDRDPQSHKGDFGSVLVIGGSASMPGAPVLAAHAALRAGAGRLYLTVLGDSPPPSLCPEIMLRTLNSGRENYTRTDITKFEDLLSKVDAVVLGPGLGVAPQTVQFVLELLRVGSDHNYCTVIDADALTILAEHLDQHHRPDLTRCVLTPHPGEAARLLNTDVAAVQSDRYAAALKLWQQTEAVSVLKGAASIVIGPGAGCVNTSGNAFMATAGSGDVLAGMIAGLAAQGASEYEAALYATFLHGASADYALREMGRPLVASDLIDFLPHTINHLCL